MTPRWCGGGNVYTNPSLRSKKVRRWGMYIQKGVFREDRRAEKVQTGIQIFSSLFKITERYHTIEVETPNLPRCQTFTFSISHDELVILALLYNSLTQLYLSHSPTFLKQSYPQFVDRFYSPVWVI